MAEIDLVEDWDGLSFEDRIDALKRTITVIEVAELLGLEPDRSGKIPSPWNPDERTPSCQLYEDHFWDFSTGQGGDLFDLVRLLDERKPSLTDAVRLVRDRAVRAGKEVGDVEHQQPRALLDFGPQLTGQPLTSWSGLDVSRFELTRTPEGDILVPHKDDGGVYGVKVRYANGGKGAWAGSQFAHRLYTKPAVWRPGYVPTQHAVICEGESDCWAMSSVLDGIDVYALPSGAGTWKDHWLDDLACYNKIWLAMDHDASGKRALDRLLLKVGYARAVELVFPTLMNDVRAAVESGWHPSMHNSL